MQISLFSVDLKLVEADDPVKRSFRVLEFNDGLRSGFAGYNALGGEKMITGRVSSDYQNLFPQLRLVDLNGHGSGGINDSRMPLVIPRGDRLATQISRADLIIAQRMESMYCTLNGNLHFSALCDNKAYQFHMAQEMGEDDLFPRTQILPTDPEEGLAALQTDARAGHYVLKPLTLCGGTGIRLIEEARLEKDMAQYLKRKKWVWHKDEWIGLHDPACLLQDRITANKVETENGVFDGTMRVAFSIYGAGNDLQCHIHDAYWKLPAYTIEEDEGSESMVSFSPSNMEKPKKRSLAALFRWAGNEVMAAPVMPDTTAWLFPALQGKLARYFGFVAASDHFKNTAGLLQSDAVAKQTLGIMMATQPAFYPAVDRSALDMHYPQPLVEKIGETGFAKSGMGHAFETLREATYRQGAYMHCEDIEGEFETPLRGIVERATFHTSSLMNTLQYALRFTIK